MPKFQFMREGQAVPTDPDDYSAALYRASADHRNLLRSPAKSGDQSFPPEDLSMYLKMLPIPWSSGLRAAYLDSHPDALPLTHFVADFTRRTIQQLVSDPTTPRALIPDLTCNSPSNHPYHAEHLLGALALLGLRLHVSRTVGACMQGEPIDEEYCWQRIRSWLRYASNGSMLVEYPGTPLWIAQDVRRMTSADESSVALSVSESKGVQKRIASFLYGPNTRGRQTDHEYRGREVLTAALPQLFGIHQAHLKFYFLDERARLKRYVEEMTQDPRADHWSHMIAELTDIALLLPEMSDVGRLRETTLLADPRWSIPRILQYGEIVGENEVNI